MRLTVIRGEPADGYESRLSWLRRLQQEDTVSLVIANVVYTTDTDLVKTSYSYGDVMMYRRYWCGLM